MLDSLPSPTSIPAFDLCAIHTSSEVLEPFLKCLAFRIGIRWNSLQPPGEPRAQPQSQAPATVTCPSLLPWPRAHSQSLLGPAAWAFPSIHQGLWIFPECLSASTSLPPCPCHGIVCLGRETDGRASCG